MIFCPKNPSKRPRCRAPLLRNRRGTTLVEMAFVLPVFVLFIFALFEFGHVLMVANSLTSIAKQAAHYGSFEDSTTADVTAYATEKLDSIIGADNATIWIKDGAAFESSSDVDLSTLSNISLQSAESRQIFVVHIRVPYDSVSLMPAFWTGGIVLEGTSIMRRE